MARLTSDDDLKSIKEKYDGKTTKEIEDIIFTILNNYDIVPEDYDTLTGAIKYIIINASEEINYISDIKNRVEQRRKIKTETNCIIYEPNKIQCENCFAKYRVINSATLFCNLIINSNREDKNSYLCNECALNENNKGRIRFIKSSVNRMSNDIIPYIMKSLKKRKDNIKKDTDYYNSQYEEYPPNIGYNAESSSSNTQIHNMYHPGHPGHPGMPIPSATNYQQMPPYYSNSPHESHPMHYSTYPPGNYCMKPNMQYKKM